MAGTRLDFRVELNSQIRQAHKETNRRKTEGGSGARVDEAVGIK